LLFFIDAGILQKLVPFQPRTLTRRGANYKYKKQYSWSMREQVIHRFDITLACGYRRQWSAS